MTGLKKWINAELPWAHLVGAVSEENLFNSTTLYWILTMHKPYKKCKEINWWCLEGKDIKSWLWGQDIAFWDWAWNMYMILLAMLLHNKYIFMIGKWENADK